MNLRAQRNVDQRQGVARQNVGFSAAHNCLADFNSTGSDDVSLLPVEISNKSDMRRPIRIIFNLCDPAWHAFLVTLEINDAIEALVTASPSSHRHASIAI